MAPSQPASGFFGTRTPYGSTRVAYVLVSELLMLGGWAGAG